MFKLFISLWFVFLAAVPAMAETTPAATCDCTNGAVEMSHVVRPGDTLSGIARSFGVSVKSILASPYNRGIKNPDLIYPGQKVVISLTAEVKKPAAPAAEAAVSSTTRAVSGSASAATPGMAHKEATAPVSPAPRAVTPKEVGLVVPARPDLAYTKFGFLVAVFLAVEFLLLGVYLFLKGTKKEPPGPETQHSDQTMHAQEIITVLSKVKVRDLVQALRTPMVIDRSRRPVVLSDIPALIASDSEREYLQDLLVKDLNTALRSQGSTLGDSAPPS